MDFTAAALALGFIAAAAAGAFAWLAGPALLRGWRRRRVRQQAFPPAWRAAVRRRWPAFAQFPADVQLRLKKRAQVLLAEVPFIGCAGLEVTDEMRVLVAMQAALPALRLGDDAYPALRQVLLYPTAFVVPRSRTGHDGVVHDERQTLSGESWQQGQVVLSWADVLAGAADADDGDNVVVHEFAHQIDQAQGPANGAPWLPTVRQRRRWAGIWNAEFAALRERLARGEKDLLGAYAATAPAECFAVASERFFEMPEALAAAHPAMYEELCGLYRVDPRQWRGTAAGRPNSPPHAAINPMHSR